MIEALDDSEWRIKKTVLILRKSVDDELCGPWWQAISDKKVTCSTFYIDDYGNEDTGDDNKQNNYDDYHD